jgi:hypothetical protein
VASAQDGFLWCSRLDLLFLVSKLSLVGGDMEGLHCHLHRSMNYSCQVRVQSLLIGVVPSHRTIYAGAALDHLSWGVRGSRDG